MILTVQKSLIAHLKQNCSLPVYSYVPPHTNFPYIYIAKVNFKDWSSKSWQGIEVIFNFNIFDKNTSNGQILDTGYQIKQVIENFQNDASNNFQLARIITKSLETSFNKVHNLYQANFSAHLYLIKESYNAN